MINGLLSAVSPRSDLTLLMTCSVEHLEVIHWQRFNENLFPREVSRLELSGRN
jgi:hypothetical protein